MSSQLLRETTGSETYLALVLDGVDGALGDPVDRSRRNLVAALKDGVHAKVVARDQRVASREFFHGQISHGVDAEGVAEVLGIVVFDKTEVGLEDLKTVHEFALLVHLVVLADKVIERWSRGQSQVNNTYQHLMKCSSSFQN